MAVGFDAASESHTGTAGSTSQASFSWTHPVTLDPRGALVFTFANANADYATAVSYGGTALAAVSGGRAVDTAGEPGDCKAWFVGSSITTTTAASNGWKAISDTAWGGPSSLGTANEIFKGVDHANGYWVAANILGKVLWSTDPTASWTVSADISGGGGQFFCIAYGNGYWVAAGSGGILYYATDPTGTWTAGTSGFGIDSIVSVAYGNGYWTAVGTSGKIRYRATDPTGTWTAATSGTTTSFNTVAYGNGYWTAVQNGGGIRYRATSPAGTWTAATSGTTSGLNGVAYGNGYWTAVGGSGTIVYRATDPAGTWTAATSGNTANILKVRYADGYWLATANTGVATYRATDPAGTWTSATTTATSTSALTDLCYGGTGWIVVGSDGDFAALTTVPIAYYIGPQITVTRTNNSTEMYAAAATVTALQDTSTTGVVLQQEDQALAATAVNDGSPGTNSLRFAGVNSGLAAPPTPNSGSTEIASIDLGTRVIAAIREDTAGQGSRNIGWTAASDDVAAVYLAVREGTGSAPSSYSHSGWGIPTNAA